jgi:hypothetical protein
MCHTLKLLHEQGVPKTRIHLWVASEAEARHYRTALQQASRAAKAAFGDWSQVSVNIGVKGLAAQRATISYAYPEGKCLAIFCLQFVF